MLRLSSESMHFIQEDPAGMVKCGDHDDPNLRSVDWLNTDPMTISNEQ